MNRIPFLDSYYSRTDHLVRLVSSIRKDVEPVDIILAQGVSSVCLGSLLSLELQIPFGILRITSKGYGTNKGSEGCLVSSDDRVLFISSCQKDTTSLPDVLSDANIVHTLFLDV